MAPMRPLLCLALAAAGCAAAIAPPAKDPWPRFPDASFAWVGGYLQVTGVGKPGAQDEGPSQRRSASRDAAILDARARLHAYLQRLMAPGGSSVGELATGDPAWKRRLDAAVSTMEIAGTTWTEGDAAAVVARAEKAALTAALGFEPR